MSQGVTCRHHRQVFQPTVQMRSQQTDSINTKHVHEEVLEMVPPPATIRLQSRRRPREKQLPEPNMPVSTLISQAMGSRCFLSLGLALILPSAPAAFPESPSDELPWKPLLPLPICASSSLVWDFLFSQQEGPSQHEALSSA